MRNVTRGRLTGTAIVAAGTLVLAGTDPAFAQSASQSTPSGTAEQASGPSQAGGQSGARQQVSRSDLQKYMQALETMGQDSPEISQSLEQGEVPETSALNQVPQETADQAIQQSGLSKPEFRRITSALRTNQQARQQFRQMAQAQGQLGAAPGASPEAGVSGAAPGASPEAGVSGAAPGASPEAGTSGAAPAQSPGGGSGLPSSQPTTPSTGASPASR